MKRFSKNKFNKKNKNRFTQNKNQKNNEISEQNKKNKSQIQKNKIKNNDNILFNDDKIDITDINLEKIEDKKINSKKNINNIKEEKEKDDIDLDLEYLEKKLNLKNSDVMDKYKKSMALENYDADIFDFLDNIDSSVQKGIEKYKKYDPNNFNRKTEEKIEINKKMKLIIKILKLIQKMKMKKKKRIMKKKMILKIWKKMKNLREKN